jgi:glycosyltransferase involved in cell wall biosynthesis
MQIAFDAKRAFLNSSGLGNYARTLIRSLDKNFPENKYHLFTPKTAVGEFNSYAKEKTNFQVRTPESFIDKKLRSRWRSYGITNSLKEFNPDVYHGLSNELPFNIAEFKGKKIVTIHDLIFLRHPELYPYLDRKIYNKKFRHACDAADVVLAISEETKKDIEQHYFVPENKIRVIYQSCDENFYSDVTPEAKDALRLKYNLPSEFLLYVGTIEERKNLLTIVKALKQVKDIPLVVIGKRKGYFDKVLEFINANALGNRVVFPQHVSNEELPGFYQMASAFIFPSFFEGFGIPILEALTSKVPVITSKGGCFPEAGGPDSIYIDPLNDAELADNLNKLLSSDSLRKQIAEKGFTYAKKFHPDKISAQMMNLYKQS